MANYLINDNKEHKTINDVLSSDFMASASKAGIMKLYTEIKNNLDDNATDGAPTTKAVKSIIDSHTHTSSKITDLYNGGYKSSSGWAYLPNGTFMCWGQFENTGGHGNIVTVTFPKAFSNTNYAVCYSQTASSSNETWSNTFITEKGTSYFKFDKIFSETLSSLNYIAIGY